jgi:hypothetical protein
MWPSTRQTAVNIMMFAAALAVVAAIVMMKPAARAARPELAPQSAGVSAANVTPADR